MWTRRVLRSAAGLFRGTGWGPRLSQIPVRRHLSCLQVDHRSVLQYPAKGPPWCHLYGDSKPTGLLALCRTLKKDTKSTLDFPAHPVTVTDIKQYLRSKGVPFHDGYSCLHAPSIFKEPKPDVLEGSGKESYSIFIDKTTGQFLCKDTLVEGSWEDLQDCLEVMQKEGQTWINPDVLLSYSETLEEQEEREMELKEVQRIWNSSVALSDLLEDEAQLVKTMFQINKLTNTTLRRFAVRFFKPTKSLVFPWFSGRDSSLRGLKLLSASTKENDQVVYTEATVPKSSNYHNLFGIMLVGWKDTEVVLTGSEIDSMAVSQATGLPTVALPRGVSCLPPVLLPYLEQFKKVTLWLGGDIRSWEASKIFSRKLGLKRCYLVRPGEYQPCPSEALLRGRNLARIVKASIPAAHKSIVSFKQLREDVFGELANMEQVAGIKWARFPELTRLLKGHRNGELTVFTGMANAKPTFIPIDIHIFVTNGEDFFLIHVQVPLGVVKPPSSANMPSICVCRESTHCGEALRSRMCVWPKLC